MEKKKKDKIQSNLTSMQEFSYQKEFKRADRAGGFAERKAKR